jgi:hypothetical protein
MQQNEQDEGDASVPTRRSLMIQMGKGILTKEHDDPSKHHRQPMRLPAYDYSSDGAYFVTICLQERKPILEEAGLHTILIENWDAFYTLVSLP